MNILLIIIWLIGFVASFPAFIKIAASPQMPPHEEPLDYAYSAIVVLIFAVIWPVTIVLATTAQLIKRKVETP